MFDNRPVRNCLANSENKLTIAHNVCHPYSKHKTIIHSGTDFFSFKIKPSIFSMESIENLIILYWTQTKNRRQIRMEIFWWVWIVPKVSPFVCLLLLERHTEIESRFLSFSLTNSHAFNQRTKTRFNGKEMGKKHRNVQIYAKFRFRKRAILLPIELWPIKPSVKNKSVMEMPSKVTTLLEQLVL